MEIFVFFLLSAVVITLCCVTIIMHKQWETSKSRLAEAEAELKRLREQVADYKGKYIFLHKVYDQVVENASKLWEIKLSEEEKQKAYLSMKYRAQDIMIAQLKTKLELYSNIDNLIKSHKNESIE